MRAMGLWGKRVVSVVLSLVLIANSNLFNIYATEDVKYEDSENMEISNDFGTDYDAPDEDNNIETEAEKENKDPFKDIIVEENVDKNGREAKPIPSLTGDQGFDAAAIAASQLGFEEDPSNIHAYTIEDEDGQEVGQGQEWCAYFASWASLNATGWNEEIWPYCGGTLRLVNFFKARGRWHDKVSYYWDCDNEGTYTGGGNPDNYTPQPGDFVAIENYEYADNPNWTTEEDIYDGPGHTGIVYSVDGSVLTTVEGNISNRVVMCRYNMNTNTVYEINKGDGWESCYSGYYYVGLGEPNYNRNSTGLKLTVDLNDGSVLSGSSYAITGNVKNGGTYPWLELFIDYNFVAKTWNNEYGNYAFYLDTTKYDDGEHLLGVKIKNEDGVDYTSWYKVIMDNEPILSVDLKDGSVLSGSSCAITGSLRNGGTYPWLELFIDYSFVAKTWNNEYGNYAFYLDTTKYDDGEHLLGVKIKNEDGVDYTSWYTITVNNKESSSSTKPAQSNSSSSSSLSRSSSSSAKPVSSSSKSSSSSTKPETSSSKKSGASITLIGLSSSSSSSSSTKNSSSAGPAQGSSSAKPAGDSSSTKPAGDSSSTKPAEDSSSTKPAGDSSSTKPAEDSSSTKPAEGSSSTKSAEDSSSTKPAEGSSSTIPAEGSSSTKPAEGSSSTRSAEGSSSTKPAEGSSSTRPAEGSSSTKPAGDSSSTKPAEDSSSTKPAGDSSSTKPAEDSSSTKPAEDSSSTRPAEGSSSTKPAGDSSSTKLAEDSSSTKPSEGSSSSRPAEDSSSTKPSEGSSSSRPAEGSSSTKPAGDSSSSRPVEGSSSTKPSAEGSSSTKPAEDSSSAKPAEDSSKDKTSSPTVTVTASDDNMAVIDDKIIVKLDGIDLETIQVKGKSGVYQCTTDPITGEKIGVVKAVKKGTIKLYVLNGKKKIIVCTIKVEQPKLKSSLKLKNGKNKKLKLSGTKTVPDSWVSSDTEVVEVSNNGMLTAKKPGSATVTATLGAHEYKCNVTVK